MTTAAGAWTDTEIDNWAGFCPKCRRVVWVSTTGWRPAHGTEVGNAMGYVRCLPMSPTDPLPRDRPKIVARLGDGLIFGKRLRSDHDCNSPVVVKDKKHGWGPRPGHNTAVFD